MGIRGGGNPSSIYVVNSLFLCLSWLMVACRVYCRQFLLRAFSPEDFFAVISLFGYTAQCIFNMMIGVSGSGSHMVDLTPQQQANGLMYWLIVEEIYIVTSVTVKISVIFVCLRLVDKRSHQIALHSCAALMIAYSLPFFCVNLFQCHPVELFWTRFLGADYINACLSENIVGDLEVAFSTINAFFDIVLSVTTCVLVYQLHLPTGGYRKSVAVVLIFGALACFAVVIRLPFLFALKGNLLDFLYYTTSVLNWSTVEIGLGIMATAGASLRPLVRTILSRSKFIGTSVDPTSTRWDRPRDKEGYFRSGAVVPKTGMGSHARIVSDDIEKIELHPMPARSKAGKILDLDYK